MSRSIEVLLQRKILFRKPVGRAQVLKLRHTMDALLERITIEDNDLHGQTQVKRFPEKNNC